LAAKSVPEISYVTLSMFFSHHWHL